MTVYLPNGGRTYRYDFNWRGRRYFGNTGQLRLDDAREWERKERVRLARQGGELALRAGETQRSRPRGHEPGGGSGVAAGEQSHRVTLSTQLLRQIRDDAFGAAIEPGRHRFRQGSDMRNTHGSSVSNRP